MKHARWFVLPVLLLAAEAALSAQFGGDPITSAARNYMLIFLQAVRYLALVAVAITGLLTMTGRGDWDRFMSVVFGGAIAFGASLVATAFFGVTV